MKRTQFLLNVVGIVWAAGITMTASAQNGATFIITSSNEVIPSQPSTTIEIWATWNDPTSGFVFGESNYDLTADDGVFSDPVNVLKGPSSSAGKAAGNLVSGASNGQIHMPAINIFGEVDNPILLASYVWTTSDFTSRVVDFKTNSTGKFIVADFVTGAATSLHPFDFQPGFGQVPINWPTPGTLSTLVIAGVVASRRRRLP